MQRQTKNCVKVHAGGPQAMRRGTARRFLRVKTCVQHEKHVKAVSKCMPEGVKTCVQHEKHVKTV